jgi:glycine/D-amino acid oxidase-like deaminating enzyme
VDTSAGTPGTGAGGAVAAPAGLARPGMTVWPDRADAVVIGGGFYGACLALFLRERFASVLLIEAREALLGRASFVNQARVHTGFHYPRSLVTARRSLALHGRFIAEFRDAVHDDFTMLYAIARDGSKVTPQRFLQMFREMGAPMSPASAAERALFDQDRIAEVVRCREAAFDADRLRTLLLARLVAAGVRIETGAEVTEVDPAPPPGDIAVTVAGRATVRASLAFNATYGQFPGDLPPLRHELAEVVLVRPPPELERYGVTVMDGPFFSMMPFPARGCHSLTHVRYTPHRAWTSAEGPAAGASPQPPSASLHMQRDAARYMPCLARLERIGSLFEVKSVPLRREADDGRPILFGRNPVNPGLVTVLGGKLDNIYDLYEALAAMLVPAAGAPPAAQAPGPADLRQAAAP